MAPQDNGSTGGASLTDVMSLVAERFPNQAARALRLVGESESFRSLCEDYALAIGTLRRLEGLGRVANDTKLEDYRALAVELERELAEHLAKSNR
jgi:hypothetical protein